MNNRRGLGVLLCGVLALAACDSETSQPAMCGDPSAEAMAAGGACAPPACTGTMRDCKNGAADGCETDVSGDLKNCGACGNKCPLPAHGAAVCVSGKCGVTSCDLAYKDCNNDSADGCEIDSARDPNNCGSCGNKCPGGANGVAACVAGKCTVTCNAPYLDCNGDATDGCEVNGDADLNNCGICKNICPTPTNGNAACAGGTCIVSSCQSPFLTCQPGPINRCETNSSNDVNNCSACGKVCGQVANGTPGCLTSACGIKSCNAPYQDCDKAVNNGCEVNTATDVKNCSGCNLPCAAVSNGTPGCTNSQCNIASCNAPYKDCDGMIGNGCETNLNTDNSNCGQCGKSCTAPMFCSNGSCVSDPCINYGGTLVTPNANIRICTTHMGWGTWDPAKIPTPWKVCTLTQWAAYAPHTYITDYGVPNDYLNWLWIDNNSCGGGSHREVAETVYTMDDAGCYDGPKCCNSDTNQYLIAVCSP